MEGGKQLLLCADGEAEAALQTELSEIQERWKLASFRLEEQKKQLMFLLKVSLSNEFRTSYNFIFLQILLPFFKKNNL